MVTMGQSHWSLQAVSSKVKKHMCKSWAEVLLSIAEVCLGEHIAADRMPQ